MNAHEFINKGFENQPTILKPATSSASRNIIAVKSSREAQLALSGRGLVPEQFTAQEQLVGPEYTCGVYVDRYSRMVSTICFERTLTPDGATGYGKIVVDQRIDEYAIAVGQALVSEGMEFGHINVQLIVDSKGPCLFEINGRLSSTEAPKAHFGYNSCAAYFYNLVLEKPYSGFAPRPRVSFYDTTKRSTFETRALRKRPSDRFIRSAFQWPLPQRSLAFDPGSCHSYVPGRRCRVL